MQSEIINIIKISSDTDANFKMIMYIYSHTLEKQLYYIDFSVNYHIIISLVSQNLSRWLKIQFSKKHTLISWQKESVVYVKEKTDLVSSTKSHDICIVLEEYFKKE